MNKLWDDEKNEWLQVKLSDEEQEIEQMSDQYVQVSDEKKKRIEAIIEKVKQKKAIRLQIAEYDLEKLKEKAAHDGMPYQTLINTILHKYITHQLLEKSEVLKSIQVLQTKEAV